MWPLNTVTVQRRQFFNVFEENGIHATVSTKYYRIESSVQINKLFFDFPRRCFQICHMNLSERVRRERVKWNKYSEKSLPWDPTSTPVSSATFRKICEIKHQEIQSFHRFSQSWKLTITYNTICFRFKTSSTLWHAVSYNRKQFWGKKHSQN